MSKNEAESQFRSSVMPGLRASENGQMDKSARREAWGVFTDSLCKNGEITQRQYDTWLPPQFLLSEGS